MSAEDDMLESGEAMLNNDLEMANRINHFNSV